ncbi:MAG: hypothetical protein ACR2KM_05590, partial [Gemmatimonadaceae bacterium]
IGAILYVARASHSWAIPEERALGIHSLTGEPFIWALYVLPILAAYTLVNLTWGAIILFRGQRRSGRFWVAAGLIWVIAVAIDFAHH